MENCALAYYYFDFNDKAKQNAKNFLSSIVGQLCTKVTEFPVAVDALFEKCNEGAHAPSLHDLSLALQDLASRSALDIYIVADALDECFDDEDREEVLELVTNMHGFRPSNLHILVTSRPELDITTKLTGYLTSRALNIQGDEVEDDIERYIMGRLDKDSKLKRWPDDVKAEIARALTNGAKGM